MFRRKVNREKPKEAVFPIDLEKLGLFVNSEDQLRRIANPDEGFDYWFHGKSEERLNERRREAVDECLRRIILERLLKKGLKKVRIPLDAGEEDPHLCILVQEGIETAQKILVLSPDLAAGGLGIWGIRAIEENSLNWGSTINTVTLAQSFGYSIVILNPGQLIWDPSTKTSLSFVSWKAKDKGSISSFIDPIKNRIPGNTTPEEHIAYVFDNILKKVPAEVNVVAEGYAAYSVMVYLRDHWKEWRERVFAMVLAESTHPGTDIKDDGFRDFFLRRVRNYITHADPRGQELLDGRFSSAVFSAGVQWPNHIVPCCLNLLMDYLKNAHENPDNCNPNVPIVLGDLPDNNEWIEALRANDPDRSVVEWDSQMPKGGVAAA